MDLNALLTFEAVARTGAVSRAAEELNCVQSNVTSRVRQLEHELGVPLFNRHSRGMTMTNAGADLLPYARQISSLMTELKSKFVGTDQIQGRLLLGSMETTAAFRIPQIASAFHADFPDVQLELRTGPTAALVKAVAELELDGAFVAGPVGHPKLREENMIVEELAIVTSSKYQTLEQALHSDRHPTLLVYRSGCLYRQRLESFLFSQGIAGTRHVVLGTVEGILGCVEANMGITIMTRSALEQVESRHRVTVHEIDPNFSRIATVFISNKDVRESAAMRHFRSYASRLFSSGRATSGTQAAHTTLAAAE
jgi:LysR family transcriptional regulator, cell division regulator